MPFTIRFKVVVINTNQILLELISGLPSFDPLRNPKDLVSVDV
jgi:hypothetical protein